LDYSKHIEEYLQEAVGLLQEAVEQAKQQVLSQLIDKFVTLLLDNHFTFLEFLDAISIYAYEHGYGEETVKRLEEAYLEARRIKGSKKIYKRRNKD